jgi:preprotein translocase subunit SecB
LLVLFHEPANLQQQKKYAVTLSLKISSKPAGELQQQKKYSVTLSLKISSKPAADQRQRILPLERGG